MFRGIVNHLMLEGRTLIVWDLVHFCSKVAESFRMKGESRLLESAFYFLTKEVDCAELCAPQ